MHDADRKNWNRFILKTMRPWSGVFGYFEYGMCPECKQKSIITTYDMQKEKYSTSALWSIFLTTKASLMQKIQLLFGTLEAVNFFLREKGGK